MKCPECGSSYVIKNGKVSRKRKKLQRYKCNKCGRNFTRKKTKKQYNPKAILRAITLYNKGYTLKEASKKINKRFHINTYPQLISNWMKQYSELCSFRRVRRKNSKECKKRVKENDLIFSKKLKHKQVYEFMYHKLKLDKFVNDYFSAVRDYLEEVEEECPHQLFRQDKARGSEIDLEVSPEIVEKKNSACQLADLALKANKDNKKRHDEIQEFMLCNDTSTLAVEVPVWLYPREFEGFEVLSGVDKAVTGHIDILQNRFGLLHILDYKPGASEEWPISQLFFYAFALSMRTGIWLRNFKCAWFDDEVYYGFSPAEIIVENEEIDESDLKKYKLDRDKQLYHEKRMFRERFGEGKDKRGKGGGRGENGKGKSGKGNYKSVDKNGKGKVKSSESKDNEVKMVYRKENGVMKRVEKKG